MSRGFDGVVFCSFGSRLAVNSGLEPGHFLSQDCHLEKEKSFRHFFLQKCHLHLLASESCICLLNILPQADILLLQESRPQSNLVFLQPPSLSRPVLNFSPLLKSDQNVFSHLLAAIVFLVLDSQYLPSFFSEETNCLALFLIIGWGRSSSMSKARALGSKSAPGTVARARSCQF